MPPTPKNLPYHAAQQTDRNLASYGQWMVFHGSSFIAEARGYTYAVMIANALNAAAQSKEQGAGK